MFSRKPIRTVWLGGPAPAGLRATEAANAMVARVIIRFAIREAGELCDMDAVGAVGGAGRDLVQEDDIALPFLDPHRVTGERRELGGERGQLVVVGREERAAAIDLVEMFERRPGDREPVI